YLPIPPTPGAVNLAPPDIATAETALDFGDVAVGKELDLDLILKNKGAADLVVVSTVVVGDDAGEWQITTGAAPFMIAPGRDHKVRVCFSPTSMGEKQAVLRIRSNDPDGDPLEIPLTGVGLAPKISASTDKVLFGRVDVASAKEMTFDLFNTGTAALKVTRITIGGSNGKQFEVVNQEVPFTLQPDDSKRFTVLFKPDTVGILKGIVRFVNNDPADEKFDVGLKGIGRQPDAQPDIAITPDSLAFGLVQTGTFASKIVTLSNEGEALLQVAGVEITGADADQWQIAAGGAPFSLAAGETHEIGLHFAPTSEGLKSAALQLASNDPDENPLLLPLSGTGVTGAGLPLAGIVVINEIHYNPATSQGSDGKFEFLELHNTSDMPIVLAGLHFSAGINHTFQPGDTLRAGGFFVLAVDSTSYPGSIEWQSGNLVNTGETVQLLDATGALVDSVSYDNSAPWPADANGGGPSLELVDPLSDNSLAGNWQASFVSGGTPGAPNSTPGEMQPDIAVSPTELDFGDVEVGRTAELVVTIANVGLIDLQVDSTVITGANADQWQITAGQAPFVLSGGESRDVSIRFMPDSAGPKEAHLRIASSDTDEPTVTVRLAGTGVTGTASPFAGIIVINEIHYNPSTEQGSDADFEFLELINTSDADIDLQGLAFAEGVVYTFQTGEILPAAGFLVLAKNATTYPGSIQWTSGNLVNTGESIKLVDENGAEVDVVVYDNSTPWPTSANGGGPSLELVHASSDNNDPLNWQASTIPGGTPGAPNSVSSVTQPDIAVRPDSLVFGIVNLRESKTLSLRIGNAGQENLEIVSLVLSGPAADQFVMGEITVPFTLAPGEEVEFPVQSNPLATGARQAELQIASNDPDENLLVIPVTMYVNSPPEAPALVAPGWGEAADRLAWRGSDPDGDELSYFLEIAEDIQFTLNLFASDALDDTSLYLTEISTFTEGASYYWRVQARDEYEAESGYSPIGYFRFVATPTSVAAAPAALPDEFALLQNYPNPFNPETQIRFQLPEVSQVLIRIFNVTGQKIRNLVDESYPAGSYAATWNGFDDSGHPVASGIYIYQLLVTTSETRSGPAFSQVRKMSLLR
ncbi:choice-of-anchor D domain-containing protein, partial [candidate division KSB1 bacterium]|nr:choice-of-anchor D domain-containing protein [candidate division KSB1 bacterium]